MNGLMRAPVAIVVLVYQSMMLALAQIWANKLRAALTAVGIVIGVASVTAVVAALTGLKQNVLSEFQALGTNKVFAFPDRPNTGPKRNAPWPVIVFQPEQFEGILQHCPSLKEFTRVTNATRRVSYGTRTENDVEITGIDPGWHVVESRSVIQGRPFTLIDNDHARPVCMLNPKTKDKLGLPINCIGESIMINQRRYTIVGIVEPRVESSMFRGESSGMEVFVPFNTLYDRNDFVVFVGASKSPELSDEARAEVVFFLRRARRLEVGEPNTFNVEFVEQFVQQFNSLATGITAVAGGVVGISLLVGGVGIMNIMLVSVSERTREIGLRKAVGARPAAILLQFLVEAVTLCLVGGAIGVLCGQGLTMLMASIPGAMLEKAAIPFWAIALSFGFSAGVGLIFGMFPAIKAARLDPIVALRHE